MLTVVVDKRGWCKTPVTGAVYVLRDTTLIWNEERRDEQQGIKGDQGPPAWLHCFEVAAPTWSQAAQNQCPTMVASQILI